MMSLPLAVMLVSACVAASAAPGPASRPSPQDAQRLDRAWRGIEPVRPSLGVRSLFDFALEAAAVAYRPDRIARALALAEQMQDRDPNSRTFGNLRWYWRAEKPEDRNAVEFCMQKGILVWMLYQDRLNGDGRQRLKRLIDLSVEGIRRHNVSESYTNIFLMKAWNCIAIGENTARGALAAEGRQMLDRWLIYTWESGIHEYLSPTYYGVDLESLGLIARHARSPQARLNATVALRLFYTDIAANWFAPCLRLGGAHSRDYDYLTGHGHLDRLLRAAGWIPTDTPQGPSAFEKHCLWPMARRYHEKERLVPRTVHQRWGAAPGQTATHYVGRHFSIGSAGANYGPMDKVLTVDLAAGPQAPVVSFLMDARGDPYGQQRFLTGGGHSKAFHVTPFVTSVQRGPEVLLLASADPSDPRFRRYAPEPTCLLSHVVIPAAAELWTADEPARPAAGKPPVELPAGGPAFLRFQDVAVGIWMKPGPARLVNDGGKYPVIRLTVTHSDGKPTRRATVAVWVRAAERLDDAGFAAFRKAFRGPLETGVSGDRVEAAAPGLKGRLRLAADVARGERIAVEGAEPAAEKLLLAVNGRDVGREILGTVEIIARYQRLLEDAAAGAKHAAKAGETVEAEAAAIILPPFRIDADATASGGKFVWMPGAPGSQGGSAIARAAWLVHVPKAGSYRLQARVQAPTPSDDSFFVRVTQGGRDVLAQTAWHTAVHRQWAWADVTAGQRQRPLTLPLRVGAVAIEFRCREDGARLDAIRLVPVNEAK